MIMRITRGVLRGVNREIICHDVGSDSGLVYDLLFIERVCREFLDKTE